MNRIRMREKLRQKLRQKQASLAEEFDYAIVVCLCIRDGSTLVYQAERVGISNTNSQIDAIMQGANANIYSHEEARELIEKDTLQIHAARWFCLSPGSLGVIENICTQVWPADVRRIEVLLYSKWKDQPDSPYRLIDERFCIHHDSEISKNVMPLLAKVCSVKKPNKGCIIFNTPQNLGLWVSSKSTNMMEFMMSSLVVCVSQESLSKWHQAISISNLNSVTFEQIMDTLTITQRDQEVPEEVASKFELKRKPIKPGSIDVLESVLDMPDF